LLRAAWWCGGDSYAAGGFLRSRPSGQRAQAIDQVAPRLGQGAFEGGGESLGNRGAAAEAAVGLAIIIALYRHRDTVDLEHINLLRG